MVAVGAWQHFWVGVGWRTWGNVIQLPSRAHTDPPPLILTLLTQSSVAPLSPIPGLLPGASWPILTNPSPEKEKEGGLSQRPGLAIEQ